MAKYIDSAIGDRDEYVRNWLDREFSDSPAAFGVQTGYFYSDGIQANANAITAMREGSKSIAFVVGANDGMLAANDLQRLLEIVQPDQERTITVVRFARAKFHPKCYYIARSDGSASALVGSSNLTFDGTSVNVEASIALDTREGDAVELLEQIRQSILRWATLKENDGAFQVQSKADVPDLVDRGVIGVTRAIRTGEATEAAPASGSGGADLPGRRRHWQRERTGTSTGTIGGPRTVVAPTGRAVTKRWSKQLSPTEALRNTGNTIGELRLGRTRKRFTIGRDYFRNDFFKHAAWSSAVRTGQAGARGVQTGVHDEAQIDFELVLPTHPAVLAETLTVKHVPHREAHQQNYVTAIKWGSAVSNMLRAASSVNGYAGYWAVLEQYETGDYRITIQPQEPDVLLIP